jgi:alpha-galactosidase
MASIQQDRDAIMASKVREGAADLWIKPLSDGTWAVALINKGGKNESVSISLSGDTDGDFYSGPNTTTASVRDVFERRELGNISGHFTAVVPPMDGKLFRFAFH